MPISPPDEALLNLSSMSLMDLYGRMRNLTDAEDFTHVIPAVWQCSDESQGIKKALFGYVYDCPSFNLGRVGALLDPTRLATAAQHGNDVVILGGSHIGAVERNGIGHIERVHGEIAPCCGLLNRMMTEYLQIYQRATQLIKIFWEGSELKIEIPYKYLFPKPIGDTARLEIKLNQLIDGDASGEGSLGKIFRMNKAVTHGYREVEHKLTETPEPIGSLLRPEFFSFRKKIDLDNQEPLEMLESSVFNFLPEIVASKSPHRRLADINTWRQFHLLASYITDTFDGSGRNVFVLAGLTIDHSIRQNSFVPQFGFFMEKGRAMEARYFNPSQIVELLAKQDIYKPPVTFLEYAEIS